MSDALPPTSQRVEIDARELGVSMVEPTAGEPQRKKVSYVGAPAIFALEQACAHINAAFDKYGCYLVGSALDRPDFRDVDVRFIMDDADFDALFPGAGSRHWEHDPRWLLLTVSISAWMKSVTGLPIDFQIQPQTHANALHKKPRHAIGFRISRASSKGDGR